METNKELTVRQQLTLKTKACLADRVIILYVLSFMLLALFCASTGLFLLERSMRVQVECAYQSSVELNKFRARQNRINRLFRVGVPSVDTITEADTAYVKQP